MIKGYNAIKNRRQLTSKSKEIPRGYKRISKEKKKEEDGQEERKIGDLREMVAKI
jgi:hypothetical protein